MGLSDDTGPVFGPIIGQLREEVAKAAGKREALEECMEDLLRGMLHPVLDKRLMPWRMALVLCEFYILLGDRISPKHETVGMLVAAALRCNPQDQIIRLGTLALAGQTISFGACRSVLCAWLDRDYYARERIDFIADTLITTASA